MSALGNKFFHWFFMVCGGVITGSGSAITLKWGLKGIGLYALLAAVFGFVLLMAGVIKLLRMEDPIQNTSASNESGGVAYREKQLGEGGEGRGPTAERSVSAEADLTDEELPDEMNAPLLCSFVLHELDRVLELLKRSRGHDDIEALMQPTRQLEKWASELALKKNKLTVGGRKVRQLWQIRKSLSMLERDWILRTGGDLRRDAMPPWTPGDCSSPQERENDYNSCSERLTHVSRQFDEEPEFRDALTSVARSLRIYMGRPMRQKAKSSGEEAFAATLRLPDLPTLEKMIQDLKELESVVGEEDYQSKQARAVQEYSTELKRLMNVTGSPESVAAWPKLKELSAGLQEACVSLETGRIDKARAHLDSVLKIVRESPVAGG